MSILPVCLHHRHVLEPVTEAECSIVVEVVAKEHVDGGRLGGNSPEGRMGVEHRHRREPAIVTDAKHPDPAVVSCHVFQQPVDGVLGVGRLVDRFGVVLGAGRAGHDELPFGLVAAADVLKDKHVPIIDQVSEVTAKVPLCPVVDPVGSAEQKDRQGSLALFGNMDLGVQFHPVPHRHHDLGVREARVGLK